MLNSAPGATDVNLHPSERIPAGIAPFGEPKMGIFSPWGWRQKFPRGDGDGGKNSPADISGRGTGMLPLHIPRPVDIPTRGNAVSGHVRCIRLVVADFVASVPYETLHARVDADVGDGLNTKRKQEQSALCKFVNKTADAGITALHMAALNGYFDCVQLLLDLNAYVSAATYHYGTSMDLIGAGSTPLHYAACGGNLKCCQILLAKGATRMALNCNGWLPLDVARMWGRHWLEPLLSPSSDAVVSPFPTSNYLSLPLMSVLNIARECGLHSSTTSSNEIDFCAVCLERPCSVAAEGCMHELCVRCALYLCSTANVSSEMHVPPGSIPCPLCRHGIISFVKLPSFQPKENKLHGSLSMCTPCIQHPRDVDQPSLSHNTPEIRKNRVASVSSEMLCPVTCTPFPSVAIPLCTTCNDGPCPPFEPQEDETQEESPRHSQASTTDQDKMEGPKLVKTTCSNKCDRCCRLVICDNNAAAIMETDFLQLQHSAVTALNRLISDRRLRLL
ncbi:hypothetical protein TSUD_291020 [Trifolium subterraneum]|uniref:RING-type E3 ubiquitin transferase n=1 Tax=Trifolium subterraneum TaxID=3900 RepID=A0A2Z6P2Y9_TRISU|nr:hypothetical protein TSUD_291020 [Trifolium subterraneum]